MPWLKSFVRHLRAKYVFGLWCVAEAADFALNRPVFDPEPDRMPERSFERTRLREAGASGGTACEKALVLDRSAPAMVPTPEMLTQAGHAMGRIALCRWAMAACAGAVLSLCAASLPAHAQGAVKNTFGEWQMRCETPPGAKSEQCALVQNVAAEDKPNVTLLVIVLKTADGRNRLLRVVAPLGVLLPAGLGLKVDQTDIGRAGFVRCLNTGCVAEVVMDDTLVGQLRAGKTATFIVFQTPEEGVGIPVSLTGFSNGFDSLP
jgi:invasion protein IalB